MKRSRLLLLVSAIFTFWLLSFQSVHAALQRDASIEITIEGILCTADKIYDIVPSYVVNPDDCNKQEVIKRINEESPTSLPQVPPCAAEVLGTCIDKETVVDAPRQTNQTDQASPKVQLATVALAVGLGVIAVIDQIALDGFIGRAVVRGGSRLIAFLKSLIRR